MVSNAFVVLMGMGTVFFGLICIVLLILLMGKVLGVKKSSQKEENKVSAPEKAAAAAPAPETDPNLIAVVSAALAEELGTSVSNVVITSITKS